MPQLLAALRTHLDYASWATTKLLEAAAALSPEELTRDFGTADRTVLGTMAHIFAADRVWLRRMRGEPQTAFLDPDRDLRMETLQTEWPELLAAWRQLAAGWTEESLSHDVAYAQFSGQAFTTPVWQIVLHVVNHATHHRGQAIGFIRTMGHQPPKLDLIFYYRELDAQKSAAASQ